MAFRITKDIELVDVEYLVQADAVINAGEIVCLEAGYATPGRTATGLKAKGVAKKSVDNTGGANGDAKVIVQLSFKGEGRRGFKLGNSSAGDAIAQAQVGGRCYVNTATTVTKTSTGRSEAGEIFRVDPDGGIWVIFD